MSEMVFNKQALFDKIANMIATTTNLPIESITDDSSFSKLGLDSLDALAMINDVEEEFNVRIPNQEVLKIKTVGQAVESFEKLLA